jgi:hypothetical protein
MVMIDATLTDDDRLLLIQDIKVLHPEVGELAVGRMPMAFADRAESPRSEGAVAGDRGGPPLRRERLAVGRDRGPVVGEEVDELVVVVEGPLGGDRVGTVGVGPAYVVIVEDWPGDGRVDERGGCENAQVVEDREGLGSVHLGTRRVDHR